MGVNGTKIRTTCTQIECKLTPAELLNYGIDLANILQQISAEEDRKKSFNEQVKSVITELESKRNKLSNLIRQKTEFRDIDVEYVMLDDATVKEVRMDTGETMIVRPARPEEQQLALQMFEQAENKAAGAQAQAQDTTPTPAVDELPHYYCPLDCQFATLDQDNCSNEEAPEAEYSNNNQYPLCPAFVIAEPEGPGVTTIQEMPHSEIPINPVVVDHEPDPGTDSEKPIVELSSFRIKVPAKDGGEYKIKLGEAKVNSSTLVEGVVKAFRQNGEDYDSPATLANMILERYPDSPERRQILNILDPNDFPLVDREEQNAANS